MGFGLEKLPLLKVEILSKMENFHLKEEEDCLAPHHMQPQGV